MSKPLNDWVATGHLGITHYRPYPVAISDGASVAEPTLDLEAEPALEDPPLDNSAADPTPSPA